MQLSLLCDVEVTMLIHSPVMKKLVTYESHPDGLDQSIMKEVTQRALKENKQTKIESFTNENIDAFDIQIDDLKS